MDKEKCKTLKKHCKDEKMKNAMKLTCEKTCKLCDYELPKEIREKVFFHLFNFPFFHFFPKFVEKNFHNLALKFLFRLNYKKNRFV